MSKMGRPAKEIDQVQFEKLCGIMCTEIDIASFFDCSVDTISRWCVKTYGETFAEVYKKKSALGRNSIRRKQYEVAMNGNVTMLIWLGKIMLDQREPAHEIKLTDKDLQEMPKEKLLNLAKAQIAKIESKGA